MQTVDVQDIRRPRSPSFALFALGFRPFFLAAGVAAVALLGLWIAIYEDAVSIPTYYGVIGWHSHEMLFGYTVAVIAGFLLTSVRNWTGIHTATGGVLAALAGLWVAGRILPFFPDRLPHVVIAAVDIVFLPALAAVIAAPLVRGRQTRNLMFLPILGALALADLLIHLELLGVTTATAHAGTYLAVDMIVLLIVVLGGRVIPFFTERALPGATPRRRLWVDRLAVAAVIAFAAAEIFSTPVFLAAVVAALGAAANALRLWGWYDRRIWTVPLLWVLHLGYAWLALGFGLEVLAVAGLISPFVALHAFTAGGIGAMTLGMMARVALGHTGRPLRAARPIALAFVLVNLAAAARVALPLALPRRHLFGIALAGSFWAAAFLLFTVVYAPILIQPRADGQPG